MTPQEALESLGRRTSFIVGEQWPGIVRIQLKVNGIPPTVNLASARMQISLNSPSAAPIVELTTAGATIVITSATDWILVVPAQVLPLDAGVYKWNFQTTNASNIPKTWIPKVIFSGINLADA